MRDVIALIATFDSFRGPISNRHGRHIAELLVCSSLVAIALALPAYADDVTAFCRTKTVTISLGYSPGGAYDAVARILAW